MTQNAARFGGREGVRGAWDDCGDGQGQRRSLGGGRPRRLLRAAHHQRQGPIRGQDVSRWKPYQGKSRLSRNFMSH